MINLPIFSSHFSLSRSILSLDKVKDDNNPIDSSGTVSIFAIAKQYKLDRIFLAEDNLCGFFEAFSNANKHEVQLCFGLNVKVVNDVKNADNSESIVTVWMKNSAAYDDILKINSFINNEGYQHPDARIDWKTLNELVTPNLIVTIPFYSGFLAQNSMNYGKNCLPNFDNLKPIFFVNEQGLPFDRDLREITLNYAEENKYKVIGGHHIYYFENKHAEALQVFRCIAKRSTVEKPELPDFCSDQFSFQSYIEKYGEDFAGDKFGDLFSIYDIKKLTNGVRLPEIKISDEDKAKFGLAKDATNYEYLSNLVAFGLKKKILSDPKKKERIREYIDRCKEELDLFRKLHIVDYILLISDIVNYAANNNIPVGFGRGSVCGSCVCFLIGITKIDPIPYKLYFSRFISEARAKSQIIDGIIYLDGGLLMDVDLDLGFDKRDLVINYLYEKYKNKVSKIGTLSTFSGKILIKEATKTLLNYTEADSKYVSDMIDKVFGFVFDLEKAYDENKSFKNWVESSNENKKCYDIARNLENLIRNHGVHPSGYAISYNDIESTVPLSRTPEGNDLCSSFDMKDISESLVKVDLLGLRSLSVVDSVERLTNIKSDDINVNDNKIYEFLENSDCYHGLFQIEARTNKSVCKDVKPKNIEDLSAVLAISRPGALQFAKTYAKFVETGEYEENDEYLDKVLGKTGNCCLFQESVMQIAHEIFGLSLDEAEQLRRIIGKKSKDEIVKYEAILYKQAEKLNLPNSTVEKYWRILEESASYSFNKCLSLDTIIETEYGDKMMFEITRGELIKGYNLDNKIDEFVKVIDIFENEVELYEVELEDGRILKCSLEHKILCEDNIKRPLKEILHDKHRVITD